MLSKVEFNREHKTAVVFTGITVAESNAIRRIAIAEIPTMAIHFVVMEEHSSVLLDEVMLHRLIHVVLDSSKVADYVDIRECECGNFPLATDEITPDTIIGCSRCCAMFRLKVSVPSDVRRRDVYAQDIVPIGNHGVRVSADDTMSKITVMGSGDCIDLTLYAIRGTKDDGARWCATAKTGNAQVADVWLNQERMKTLMTEQKTQFVQSCPREVFGLTKVQVGDIEDTVVSVDNSSACDFCNDCTRFAETQLGMSDLVSCNAIPQTRRMPITATGHHSAQNTLVMAFDVAIQRLKNIATNTTTLVQQIQDNDVSVAMFN